MLERSAWYSEYGCPRDPGDFPEYEYEAHLAILEGKAEKRRKEQKEAERDAQKANQHAG